MPDPLLTLLATIERLDAAATAPPWLTGRTQDPMVGNVYFDRHCADGSSPIEGHGGPGALGTAIGVTHSPDDAQIAAFSRNILAPLASMLRVAVEALETIGRDVQGAEGADPRRPRDDSADCGGGVEMIGAITMLDGVSLKSRPANRRAIALPWAHVADCRCKAHQTFTCDRCGRRVGYCLGASDNMPGACDFCWREEEVERG